MVITVCGHMQLDMRFVERTSTHDVASLTHLWSGAESHRACWDRLARTRGAIVARTRVGMPQSWEPGASVENQMAVENRMNPR